MSTPEGIDRRQALRRDGGRLKTHGVPEYYGGDVPYDEGGRAWA